MQLIDTALGERVSSLQQVMSELNSIAARPMNRYASDLPAQQQVKSGAYSLLRHIAADGKDEPTSPKCACSRYSQDCLCVASHQDRVGSVPSHSTQLSCSSIDAAEIVEHCASQALA